MPYDSLGRQIGDISPQDMLGPVGTPTPYNKPKPEKRDDKTEGILKSLVSEFKGAIAEAKKLFEAVTKQHSEINERKGVGSSGSRSSREKGMLDEKNMSKMLDRQCDDFSSNFKLLDKLSNAFLHKGSGYTHDVTNERANFRLISQANITNKLLGMMVKAMYAQQGKPEPTIIVESMDAHGNIGPHIRSMDQLVQEDTTKDQTSIAERRRQERRRTLFGKADPVVAWQHLLEGFFLDPLMASHLQLKKASSGLIQQGEKVNPMNQGLFAGRAGIEKDLGEANLYQRNIAEVAYATEGITLEMQKQQGMYRGNDQFADMAISSGHDKVMLEKQYLKLLQQGYKTQKDTLKVTNIGAHLSVAIGASFEQSADFANEMHMALGLSTDAVAEISRGMAATARYSNLSGEALLTAANNAKPFMESMRNAGTLTAASAKNLIGMQTSMQKFGVGSNFQELMQAITSPSALLRSSTETQTLAAVMGGSDGLMSPMMGKMANDPKELFKGMKNVSQFVGDMTGKSLSSMAKMGEEELAEFLSAMPEVDLQLQAFFGKGAGELLQLYKAAEESGKSFSDRISEINVKLKDASNTEEGRTKLMKQQADLMQTQRGDIAARTGKALEGSSTIEEALGKMRKVKATRDMFTEGAKGGLFGKSVSADNVMSDRGMKEAIRQSLTESFKETNAALKKSTDLIDDKFIVEGVNGKIDEALRSDDVSKLSKLQKQLGEAQNASNAAQMADTDPARAAAKGINSLNTTFNKYASSALMYLKLIAGANLIQGTGIASLITGGLAATGMKREQMEEVAENMNRIFGKGKLADFLKGAGSGVKDVARGFGDKAGTMGRNTMNKVGLTPARISSFKTIAADLIEDHVSVWIDLAQDIGHWFIEDLRDLGGFAKRKFMQHGGKHVINAGKKVIAHGVNAGRGIMNAGRGAVDIGNKMIANPRAGFGEGVFRFARAQEKIPVWGRFAKMFGGGKEAAKQTVEHFSQFGGIMNAAKRGTSGAQMIGEAGAFGSLKGLGAVASKAAMPLMIFMTALDSVSQALKTGARAAEIFDVAESQLTNSQRAAAENAGFLTGIVNSLSFGLLSYWIGPSGAVTEGLARFLESFKGLSVLLSIVMVPFKAIYAVTWGLLEGIWEIIKGIWDGIMNIFNPIGAFGELWDVLVDIMSPLSAVFGEFKEGGSWVDLIIGSLKMVGTAVGWLFKALGWLIGSPLLLLAKTIKVLMKPAIALAKILGHVLKPIIHALSLGIGFLVDEFAALWNIVSAIFTLDSNAFVTGITNFFYKIPSMFGSTMGAAFNSVKPLIWDLFRSLVPGGQLLPPGQPVAPGQAPAGPGIGGFMGNLLKMPLKAMFPQLLFLDGGGQINKTGLALVHAGEVVVPAEKSESFEGMGGFGGLDPKSPIDSFVSSAATNEAATASIAVAKPLSSVQSRIEQDYAASAPQGATVSSPEMTIIANLTEKQLSLMTLQLEELRAIKEQLNPQSSAGIRTIAAASARSNTKPLNSPDYHDLSFGGFGGNASKGYINDGVT